MDQDKTPIFDAIIKHINNDITAFHVPGHKQGNGLKELRNFFGENLFKADLNAMEDIDDYCNPVSSIKESEELLADAFGAEHAFMLLNGTTSGIQAMMLATLKPGDKIILPRNSHKSTISGLILTGAIPVYLQSDIHPKFEIPIAVSTDALKKAFANEPQAVASMALNPSYYGFATDLKSFVDITHQHESISLVDEAHGCHFTFNSKFPSSAIAAGADLVAASTHKSSGSLTQSSILLLQNNRVKKETVNQSLNILRSTSGSYPLMLSIEAARKQLALSGEDLLNETLKLAMYARNKINELKHIILIEEENKAYFDPTKISIYVRDLGLTGFEAEYLLRSKYKIQIELAEMNTLMALITIGDTKESVDKLIFGIQQLESHYSSKKKNTVIHRPDLPEVIITPRDAFYQHKRKVKLEDSKGEISGEMIMAYPPGIPIICPGEKITKEIIDYIKLLKNEHSSLQGATDPFINEIMVLGS